MERSEAVQAAKKHATEIFDGEGISPIRLEEINYDAGKDEWQITVGFAYQRSPSQSADHLGDKTIYSSQQYKVVHIRDRDGEFVGLTDRLLTPLS